MTQGWLAALGALGVGVIAFLMKALKAKALEGQVTALGKDIEAKDKRISDLEALRLKDLAQWATETKQSATDLARREAVIAALKAELLSMADSLATCSDPTVIRGRLNNLFAGEEPS